MTNIRGPIYNVRKPDSISGLARFKWQEGVSNIRATLPTSPEIHFYYPGSSFHYPGARFHYPEAHCQLLMARVVDLWVFGEKVS